jgi:hypothetical protein
MIKADLKVTVLELCAEDYYGVWELYWNYQGLTGTKEVDDELFIATLEELVAAKEIVSYEKNKYNEKFEQTIFEVERLRSELKAVKADKVTEQLYWFGHG